MSAQNGKYRFLFASAPFSGVEVRTDAATKTYAAHVAVLAQLKDKAGVVVQKFSEDLPRQGALEDQEKTRRGALHIQRLVGLQSRGV